MQDNRHYLRLGAASLMVLVYTEPCLSQPVSRKTVDKVCLEDREYREVDRLLLKAGVSSAHQNYNDASKLLDKGIERFRAYTTANDFDSCRDPNTVLLNDTGFYLMEAHDLQKKGNWSRAVALKVNFLKENLEILCEELAYKADHHGCS